MILLAVAALLVAGALVLIGVVTGSLPALLGSIAAAAIALAVLAAAVIRAHRRTAAGPDAPAGAADPRPGQRPASDEGRSGPVSDDGRSRADPEDADDA